MELQGVVKKWGFRLLKLFILFSLTTCLSVISYWRLYSSWSKKDVNMLPVYFDFRGEESFANVSLVMDNLPRSRSKPFSIKLENGQTYSIQSMFYVAKSPRNQQLGKVTVVMNMIDSGGEVVESSLRPLIVPYHSSTYLFLESVFLFPLKFLNLNELYQYQLIMLDMFSDYTERHVAYPATTRIEVILSDSQIDLSNSYIIISRKLSWISKLLLKRPLLCFIIGVSFINATILMTSLAVYVIYRVRNMPIEPSAYEDDSLNFDSTVIQNTNGDMVTGAQESRNDERIEGLRRRRR